MRNTKLTGISIVAALLSLAVTELAAQQVLELTNGDRLTGTLSDIAGGQWVFEHPGGAVKISPAEVASLTAPDPIGVRLDDGTIAAATVSTSGGQLQLSLSEGGARTVQPAQLAAVGDPANLEALVPLEVGFFSPMDRFWGATASLGFSDKSGNSQSRGLGAAIQVGRNSPKDRLTLKAGLNREEAPGASGDFEKTVEKYYGSLRADIFVGPRFFLFAFTGHERDTFQDIDLRSQYNGGFGYQVIATDQTDLRFYTSGGLRVENFTSGGDNSTAVVASGAGLRQALGPAWFDWSVDWSPSVENIEDYRLLSEASLTTSVIGGLGFRLAMRNEYNNNPQTGIEKHDMLISSALTYSIGR
jgi:putative salt-induced outer membrane protein YdiY